MMVALLLYAYAVGIYSSRRIAKACTERVDFMSIVALQAPDFRTNSEFRHRHLAALSGLFVQVLSSLVSGIDASRRTGNLSSVLRVFILEFYKDVSDRQARISEESMKAAQ
jgi:hypothetical protein